MDSNDTRPPEEDRPEDESSTVGTMLRAAREERELTLGQLATELRIEARFLKALEEDDFDNLAEPVFTKGYIKQYGQRVGLDYGDLLAQYYRQVEVREVPVKASRPIRLRDEQQIAQWIGAGVILTALVVGFGVWYLPSDLPLVEVSPIQPASDPGMNEETVVEVAPPELPAEALPLEPTVQAPPPDPSAEPPPPAEPPADPAPFPEPATAVAGDAAPEAADPEPELPLAPTVQVTITFDQDCWTEVTDARGERFFYGLGSAGAVSSFDARLPLSFFLGNAGGVRLAVNGRPYPIPAESRQGNLARFVIAEGP